MKLRRFAALFSSIVENKIKLESGGHRGTMESRSLTPYTWPENYGVPWNNYKSLSRDMISFPVLIKRNNETWMRRRGHKSGFLSIIGYIVDIVSLRILSKSCLLHRFLVWNSSHFFLFFFFFFLSTRIVSRESGNHVTDCFHTREMSFSLNFFLCRCDEKS